MALLSRVTPCLVLLGIRKVRVYQPHLGREQLEAI